MGGKSHLTYLSKFRSDFKFPTRLWYVSGLLVLPYSKIRKGPWATFHFSTITMHIFPAYEDIFKADALECSLKSSMDAADIRSSTYAGWPRWRDASGHSKLVNHLPTGNNTSCPDDDFNSDNEYRTPKVSVIMSRKKCYGSCWKLKGVHG